MYNLLLIKELKGYSNIFSIQFIIITIQYFRKKDDKWGGVLNKIHDLLSAICFPSHYIYMYIEM